jgi:deoxyribodipyrimidine photo-lyase
MKTALYWFRNDLRTHDLAGLSQACKNPNVLAVYCFDPRHFAMGDYGILKTGPFRAQFLRQTVQNLREALHKRNIPLWVSLRRPEEEIPDLVERYGVTDLYFQNEWTRDEREVERALSNLLPQTVRIHKEYDQFLFHPEDIPYSDISAIPEVFTGFRKRCEKHTQVRPLLPEPECVQGNTIEADLEPIPSLEDLGLREPQQDDRSAFPFAGGQDAAMDRLQDYFWRTKRLSYYKRTRNGLLGADYSSKFSPWLANGSLSARQIYHAVRAYEKEVIRNRDTYWMIFELIWRDYFKYISLKHGDAIFKIGGIKSRTYHWNRSKEAFEGWSSGRTSNDFINANMIELARTGWMSNRGRQNTASYWAKTLKQDWRIGAAWFEYLLLDYDVHSNWGNWMYNSGVGNDPRDRVFNPDTQASRYDSDGRFRRTWTQPSLFESPEI